MQFLEHAQVGSRAPLFGVEVSGFVVRDSGATSSHVDDSD